MPGHSWAGTTPAAAKDGGAAGTFVASHNRDCLHQEARGLSA